MEKHKQKVMSENKMYKTEMCKNYEEHGMCRYNEKCQFAHSIYELRNIARHPRYKTEVCRNILDNKFCKYGKRCCFLHIHDHMGSLDCGYSLQSHCAKGSMKACLEFKSIWDSKADKARQGRARLTYMHEKRTPRTDMLGQEMDYASIGSSLSKNHALVWTKDPIFYIEEKHRKYYEYSEHNMAPGEPVLPHTSE